MRAFNRWLRSRQARSLIAEFKENQRPEAWKILSNEFKGYSDDQLRSILLGCKWAETSIVSPTTTMSLSLVSVAVLGFLLKNLWNNQSMIWPIVTIAFILIMVTIFISSRVAMYRMAIEVITYILDHLKTETTGSTTETRDHSESVSRCDGPAGDSGYNAHDVRSASLASSDEILKGGIST